MRLPVVVLLGFLVVSAVAVSLTSLEPAREPDEGTAKEEAFRVEDSKVGSVAAREDTSWSGIWAKADAPGFRVNLNQPAKAADALLDNWTLIFHLDAPFRDVDALHFCGPGRSVGIQVLDASRDVLLFDGVVENVKPCG